MAALTCRPTDKCRHCSSHNSQKRA